MGASGRIGNRALLQAVADALQMEGVTRAPGVLNTDVVNVVYDLAGGGGGGMPGRTIISGQNTGNNVAGLIAPDFRVLGDPNVSTSPLKDNADILPGTNTFETRVLALSSFLNFDAAGALAFNGKTVNLYLSLLRQGVAPDAMVVAKTPMWTIATGETQYWWALDSASWSGYVPAELDLWLTIESADGTAFPANTSWDIYTHMIQQPFWNQLPA